jgi:hypothetical protein
MAAVRDYQTAFKTFQEEKAGLSGGAGFMIVMRTETEGGEEAEPEPIDVNEVPAFFYTPPTLQDTLPHAIRRLGMLAVFNLVFFAAAFTAFVRYDVR